MGDQHDLMTAALGTSDPDRSATEYYLVSGRRRGGGPITIQYWFFYSFNYQPLAGTDIFKGGYHEGDFESVGVLLSGGEHRPRYLWMNRHNEEGRVFPWSDATLQRTGEHPSVFVARGSHASYESCSDQVRFVVKHHVVDDHPACEERNPLHLAPEATPLTDLSRVAWACWQGNFGHRKGKGGFERIPHLVDDAPLSPLWQQRLGGVVSEPCRGVNDPGGRDGPGEEVVEEETGVPAKLRRRASRANTLVDECSDWGQPPAVGAYMVACSQPDLTAYLRSGLQDPGSAGLRIDVASSSVPEIGEVTVPAVRSDPSQRYFDDWRIASAAPADISVFASCRQGERVVAARFKSVRVDPRTPLRLLDRGPEGIWRLTAEDGTVAGTAAPFISDFKEDGPAETAAKPGEILACGGS
jgi:hypothetical protein